MGVCYTELVQGKKE